MTETPLIDVPEDWDESQPWLSVAERNDRMNRLLDSDPGRVAELLDRMAKDPVLTSRLLFTTHDPRRQPALMPFRLWDYQEVLVEWIQEAIDDQEPLLIEKSRDMGVSWCVITALMHRWLFADEHQFTSLVTSRKKEMIDAKTEPDTFFERMRIVVKYMPERWRELLLPSWNPVHNAAFMRLHNPETDNSITGEPPIEDFGRQGRYTCIVYDETAALRELDRMRAAAGDSAKCHIYVSTPKGLGNPFSRLRHGGNIRVATIHWLLHPLKRGNLHKVCKDGFAQLFREDQ